MPIKTTRTKKAVATKKTAVKKFVPKITSTKKTAIGKKPLVTVSGELCFWINNGPALSNMRDLRDAMRSMSEDQFLYHTSMGRNDFSTWTLDVLGDKKCADDLLKAKNIKAALAAVEKHLKAYSV